MAAVQSSGFQPVGQAGGQSSSGTGRFTRVPGPVKLGAAAVAAFLVYRIYSSAVTPPVGTAPSDSEDAVSPELALVDSELRSRLAASERAVWEPGRTSSSAPAVASALTAAAEPRRHRRRVVLLAVLASAAIAVAAFALARDRRGTRDTGASDAAPAAPASAGSARSATSALGSGLGASAGRNFVWAPAHGAVRYDIEIVRTGTVVFSEVTTVPHVHIPVTWRLGGRLETLAPGTYHWYVWPVTPAGRTIRHGPAIVATTFIVVSR